jgi:hypothetical protein
MHLLHVHEQLSSFIALLLSLYYILQVTQAIGLVTPFIKAELANLHLEMCPDSWQNQ